MSTPPVVLTIAGSDSGGGAGIQADLTTFAALRVHGATAVTAITVQDTTGVHAIHPLPPDVVVDQVRAVVHDLAPRATKTGMLGDATTARAVGTMASQGMLPRLVVDPVLVSTSGHALTTHEAVVAMRTHLLPHATVITPNTDEAAALLACPPATALSEQTGQARELLDLGCAAVVVTGGLYAGRHGPGPRRAAERVDVLATRSGIHVLGASAIDTQNDHGTGCTFASAVAAGLAHGLTVEHSVSAARAFVRAALTTSAGWRLGRGRGPVSHLAPIHPHL